MIARERRRRSLSFLIYMSTRVPYTRVYDTTGACGAVYAIYKLLNWNFHGTDLTSRRNVPKPNSYSGSSRDRVHLAFWHFLS